MSNDSFLLHNIAPPIIVIVTANLSTPLMVGQTGNTLTCNITGAERLSPTITYQWTRNDGTTQTQFGTNSSILTLSPLKLSNAGGYNCSVTVSSSLLNNDIISMNSSHALILQSESMNSNYYDRAYFFSQQFQIHSPLLSLVAVVK